MKRTVTLRKLLSAHKSHFRDTNFLTGALPIQVLDSRISHVVSVPGQNRGKVNPRRQRGWKGCNLWWWWSCGVAGV